MIKQYLIRHPSLLGRLYKIKLGLLHNWLDEILKEQRKKGLILVKNVSGKRRTYDKSRI